MYLHEVFTRLGLSIEVEPIVPVVTGRIDFRIGSGADAFLAEARCLIDRAEFKGTERRLAQVLDELDDLDSPDFLLEVQHSSVGSDSARTRDLRQHLSAWLEELDWSRERSLGSDTPEYEPPRTHWGCKGWELSFAAWAKSPQLRGRPLVRTVGISGSGEMMLSKDAAQLRDGLQQKSKKYSGVEQPFVIALLSTRSLLDDDDIESALYGSCAVRVLRHADGSLTQHPYRQRDGLWMGPKGPHNRKVAAVLAPKEAIRHGSSMPLGL